MTQGSLFDLTLFTFAHIVGKYRADPEKCPSGCSREDAGENGGELKKGIQFVHPPLQRTAAVPAAVVKARKVPLVQLDPRDRRVTAAESPACRDFPA